MTGVMYISCIRFSIQLLISECAFVTEWRRRKHFPWCLLGGLIAYFLCASAVFKIAMLIPIISPVILILYYLSLLGLSMGLMKICFEVKAEEILFAGVCGYATQHIAFACVTLVTQFSSGFRT